LTRRIVRRYRKELTEPAHAAALEHLCELTQKQTLTLLTATTNAWISEAALLADLIASKKRARSG
jgi:uncharacterized protein YeaO (DUF488 family)